MRNEEIVILRNCINKGFLIKKIILTGFQYRSNFFQTQFPSPQFRELLFDVIGDGVSKDEPKLKMSLWTVVRPKRMMLNESTLFSAQNDCFY